MSNTIQVKFDNILPDEEVHKILWPSSAEEGGSTEEDVQETKITGIVTPLIKFNDKTIQWQDIDSFSLSSEGFLPEMSMSFYDSNNSLTMLDTPGPDNNIIIEILSKFDKVYKKIKLRFYIDTFSVDNYSHLISVRCIYKCDKLNDSIIESFGKITTYKFFEEAAHRLKLGLCSNIEDSNDERYIYLANDSLLDSLQTELTYGGNPTCILNGWVDWWNNINIVNVYDLYNGQPEQNLKVWVCGNFIDVDAKTKDQPTEIDAVFTNDIRRKGNPLYAYSFEMINESGSNFASGTDRAINTFDLSKGINDSLLIQDGSGVKEDVYTQYYYNGEFLGDQNDGSYLYNRDCIDMYNQKINNTTIRIEIPQPCLGLMRGGKVNVEWYDDSDANGEFYKEQNKSVDSDVPVTDEGIEDDGSNQPFSMVINKKISGQYYIVDTHIEYERGETPGGNTCAMRQWFTLSKLMKSYNYSDATKENNY